MNAGYALLVEEYTRQGTHLLDAVDQTAHLRAGGGKKREPGAPATPSVSENERALAELKREMARFGMPMP